MLIEMAMSTIIDLHPSIDDEIFLPMSQKYEKIERDH
jgi:hypothetical protein